MNFSEHSRLFERYYALCPEEQRLGPHNLAAGFYGLQREGDGSGSHHTGWVHPNGTPLLEDEPDVDGASAIQWYDQKSGNNFLSKIEEL